MVRALRASLRTALRQRLDRACDGVLGITTQWSGSALQRRTHFADPVHYEPIDYASALYALACCQLTKRDVFYDLGAGLGRVICLAAALGRARRCVGVEVSPELVSHARRNATSLRLRGAPVDIRCTDVVGADLGGGSVYFLFNPFGPDTLAEVVQAIHRNVVENRRPVRILYANPLHRTVLDRADWLHCQFHHRPPFGGVELALWRSKEERRPRKLIGHVWRAATQAVARVLALGLLSLHVPL